MKKTVWIPMLFIAASLFAENPFVGSLDKNDVAKVCDSVAHWQMANQVNVKHHPLDWTNGALYRGMAEWGKTSGNQTYFDFITTIGKQNRWALLSRQYHADDICVGQSFIELFHRTGDKTMIQPTLERAYFIANHPSTALLRKTDPVGKDERWSWCDALFMAPPVYAALYSLTGDKIYLHYLDYEYKACVDSLYDREAHLFYRDNKRIPLREKNGAKQFWGRGNGWVYGGLPLIIDNLPENCSSRKYYLKLFKEMSVSVMNTQCEGGDWRTSLLDPNSYDMPENSCSAFMCFGIAWGIRNKYLSKRTYLPVLEKGWKSVVNAVHQDGKLGYIQPVGAAPKAAGYNATDVYGVGAFLLAGSEIYKL